MISIYFPFISKTSSLRRPKLVMKHTDKISFSWPLRLQRGILLVIIGHFSSKLNRKTDVYRIFLQKSFFHRYKINAFVFFFFLQFTVLCCNICPPYQFPCWFWNLERFFFLFNLSPTCLKAIYGGLSLLHCSL